MQQKTRQQADPRYTWRLEDIYPSNERWEEDFHATQQALPSLAALSGTLDSPKGLLAALRAIEKLGRACEALFTYAKMRRDEDNGNGLYQAMTDRAMGLLVRFESEKAFFSPELMQLGSAKVRSFLAQEPGLAGYRRYLEKELWLEKHTLSPEQEKLLAAAGELTAAPDTIYSMLADADLRFPVIRDEQGQEVEITHGRYIPLLESRDRRVRKDAYEGLYSTYKAFSNTIAAAYAASVKGDQFYAQARGYGSALEASLYPNAIPVAVYDSLVEAVHRHLPALHAYVALRKKALGLDKIHYYDLYTPIAPEAELGVPYERAAQIVQEGLKPLGETYLKDLSQAFTDGWVDVYENQGKTSGAYSWGVYGVHPYVLLNYNQNLDSIYTLAHELGHAMHSFYSDRNQPYSCAGYPLFLAEIASTTNEALLQAHMLKTLTDRKNQMALYNHELEQIRGTVFRQTMFAEFERKAHELAAAGESLTRERLNQIYAELNTLYYGPDMVMDDFIPYEWMRIPHFYRAYYVYQYATGYSAAVAFSRSILGGGQAERDRYLSFLAAGDSKNPLDILRDAGLDMEKPQAVESCMRSFEEALAALTRLMEA